jgi:hypothetical protein
MAAKVRFYVFHTALSVAFKYIFNDARRDRLYPPPMDSPQETERQRQLRRTWEGRMRAKAFDHQCSPQETKKQRQFRRVGEGRIAKVHDLLLHCNNISCVMMVLSSRLVPAEAAAAQAAAVAAAAGAGSNARNGQWRTA